VVQIDESSGEAFISGGQVEHTREAVERAVKRHPVPHLTNRQMGKVETRAPLQNVSYSTAK
jgi:hypothetical protein